MASGEIIFIEGEDGARFPDANTLFVDDDVPTVIDPATRPDELSRINEKKTVRLVIDSHYHVDHIRYNRLFPDADILAHPLDAPAISSIDEMARLVGVSGQTWEPLWRTAMRDRYGYAESTVAGTVSDSEEISLGANTIRIIHTPGHTPGHLCIEFIERGAVYLADIDLTEFGPWYGNEYSSVDDFLNSISRLAEIDARTWFTSHEQGLILGDIAERLGSFAGVINLRESRLREFLESPRTLDEIIDQAIIYGKMWQPQQMFRFFEGMMIEKHLDRLASRGLAVFEEGRWVGRSS